MAYLVVVLDTRELFKEHSHGKDIHLVNPNEGGFLP